MLLWSAVFLMLVGLILHIRQMEFMACTLGLLGPLAYWLSKPILRGLEVQRRAPGRLTVGDSSTVTLTVANTTARPRPAFWLEDALPPGLRAEEAAQLVLDLAPRETREISYRLRALRRGVYQLGPARLQATDVLGLHDFEQMVPELSETVVYPRTVAIPDLWPAGPGERSTPRRTVRRPGGLDPRGSREYVPGDDLRQIHWKASAHRGKLTVVEREQSQGLRATAVLDLTGGVHAGRGNETSLEYGVTLAASLLAQALAAGGAAGLVAVGDRDYSVPADSSPAQQRKLLEALARCAEGEPRGLAAVLSARLLTLPRGSAVAVITPQGGPGVRQIANLLAARGLRALWFLLVAPSWEEAGGSRRAENNYRALALALGRRGQPAYALQAGDSLETGLGRWLRAAG
jgi:uncharacterized protein (DUF58 family)